MTPSLYTNVPPSTANALSYTILVVVGIFLIAGPIIVYFYRKKNRQMKAAQPTGSQTTGSA